MRDVITAPLRIGYVGNFGPEHSTENHVRQALEANGHTVLQLQENDRRTWEVLADPMVAAEATVDLVLWTRTGWDWPLHTGWSWEFAIDMQRRALEQLRRRGVPTVGFHLDRWWGLAREHQVADEPFFTCDLVVTADGGHDDRWTAAGVNHVWMPPAVSRTEALREPRSNARTVPPVVFVGSWRGYHDEWPYRAELIAWLQRRYRRQVGLYPRGGRAVRGQELVDLYRKATVVVGDSCLAGGATRYWSDRIPETVGRGGFLVHPMVEGLAEHFGPEHLATYDLGDWDQLGAIIDHHLAHPELAAATAAAGREHVLAHHTYERRMEQLMAEATDQGLLTAMRDRTGPVHLGGVTVELRDGEGCIAAEVWQEGVYRLDPADVAGQTVVDVGAHVGLFTLWAAHHGAHHVHAYEPAQDNADRLRAHLAAAGLADRVTVHPVAVGAAGGGVLSPPPDGNSGGRRLVDDDAGEPVPTVTLAEVVATAGHVGVLKIDAEGSEYVMLADPTPLHQVDRLAMEFDGTHLGGVATPEAWGRMVTGLAELGHVEVLGAPSRGGYLYWRRYR